LAALAPDTATDGAWHVALVRVALLRSQVLNTQGKRDEARQALDLLFPREAQVEDELDSMFTCVAAPKRLLDLASPDSPASTAFIWGG